MAAGQYRMNEGHLLLKTADGDGLPGGTPLIPSVAIDPTATGTITVNTELPAAAALADTTANPTTTNIAALGHTFNGTTWDRIKSGAGAVAVGVQRMTLASDDPAVASLGVMDDWDSNDACKSVAIQVQKTAACDSANLLAAAGDYAANDVLSNDATNGAGDPWIFSNAGRIASGSGVILGADIKTSVEAFAVRVRVHLFNAAPTTSEMDDNAAFAVDLDDRAKYLGYFDFPAMTDAGEFSFAQADGINKSFNTDASGHLYAILQTLDAATNESAGMSLWVTIRVNQD